MDIYVIILIACGMKGRPETRWEDTIKVELGEIG
jgi:hypothetical protein